ncbi:hypothetical protein EI94DRAFT_1752043 [Lactarius quietus]|nr:hypothetical protein EI94DRAFT_1752043 [Lactarius quietus]
MVGGQGTRYTHSITTRGQISHLVPRWYCSFRCSPHPGCPSIAQSWLPRRSCPRSISQRRDLWRVQRNCNRHPYRSPTGSYAMRTSRTSPAYHWPPRTGSVAFAMAIEKVQGQTFSAVGIDLRYPCFRHGRLYLALFRASKAAGINCIAMSFRPCQPAT